MHLYALLLLTVAFHSSPGVMAQELPDQATAIEEIKLLGGRIKPDNASPPQTGIKVSLGGCKNFDDDGAHLLKSIENMTWLDLSNTSITDDVAPARWA